MEARLLAEEHAPIWAELRDNIRSRTWRSSKAQRSSIVAMSVMLLAPGRDPEPYGEKHT